MTPSRDQLITDYWIDSLGRDEICRKYRIGKDRLSRLFRQYGILTRQVGGRAKDQHVNRDRLELMLLPSVDEWLP